MFDFSIVSSWIHGLLTGFMPEGLAIFLECVVIGVCIMLMYAVLAIVLIYMERKVCAFFQCRLGPNRVGKYGLMQVFADVFKMLIKEIITLKNSDRLLYNLAPYMVILASILSFACLPINKGMEIINFNIGVFFLMAASSIGVVGILLAGWSSNNKFTLIRPLPAYHTSFTGEPKSHNRRHPETTRLLVTTTDPPNSMASTSFPRTFGAIM